MKSMGYEEVEDVCIGKFMELKVVKLDWDIYEVLNEMCDKLLINLVMEDYWYEIEEV